MNMATEPTAPTMKDARQTIIKVTFRASVTGLSIRFWSASEVAGLCVTESEAMLRMVKRTKPRTDAKRRKMNNLVVRQGWANARTKAVAASKASRMPGGLSSIPTTTEAIADKPQIAKRISVLILLRGVEKASVMTISFFDSGFIKVCPTRV